jgi:hypothetical protein
MAKNAIFVENSANKKITGLGSAKVCATYSSIIATCPKDCDLRKNKECYGMYGHVGLINNRLDWKMTGSDSVKVAYQEKKAIRSAFKGGPIPQDGQKGGRDLRLHTVGDCKNNTSAKILASAADDWVKRGGGTVWTLTHAWKKIKKSSWGRNISVLASLDNPDDARKALRKGYAPAKYVNQFRHSHAYLQDGINWLPCRAQVRADVGCANCRLCLEANFLKKKKWGIMFEAHGMKMNRMKERLSNG